MIHSYWLAELGIAGAYEKFAVRPGRISRVRRQRLAGRARRRERHRAPQGSRLRRLRRAIARRRGARGGQHAVAARTGACAATTPMSPAFWPIWTRGARAGRSRAKSAVVLGAGGAARAIVYALDLARLRTDRRRQPDAEREPRRWPPISAARRRPRPGGSADGACRTAVLLVNASSLGMVGQPPLRGRS